MIGTKPRIFPPITAVCLEDLVPQDQFYRHLEQALNLTL